MIDDYKLDYFNKELSNRVVKSLKTSYLILPLSYSDQVKTYLLHQESVSMIPILNNGDNGYEITSRLIRISYNHLIYLLNNTQKVSDGLTLDRIVGKHKIWNYITNKARKTNDHIPKIGDLIRLTSPYGYDIPYYKLEHIIKRVHVYKYNTFGGLGVYDIEIKGTYGNIYVVNADYELIRGGKANNLNKIVALKNKYSNKFKL